MSKQNFNSVEKTVFGIAALILSICLVFTMAFYITPLDLMVAHLNSYLKRNQGVFISGGTFKRVFPFGIEVEGLEVRELAKNRPVLKADRLAAYISPASLLRGEALLEGDIGGGEIKGTAGIMGSALNIRIKEVDLSFLPGIADAGIGIKGRFMGDLKLDFPVRQCPSGTLRLTSEALDKGVKFMGLPLPGDMESAGLDMEMTGCKMNLERLWLEGKSLSARLQGEIKISNPVAVSPINLTIEIIPKGDQKENFLLSSLDRYRKSANFYSIPVAGSLASPRFGNP